MTLYLHGRDLLTATGKRLSVLVQTACLENADAIVAGEADITTLGVEATDDKILVCHLSSPCAIFDNLMTFPSFFLYLFFL